jgi:hypothetical protein
MEERIFSKRVPEMEQSVLLLLLLVLLMLPPLLLTLLLMLLLFSNHSNANIVAMTAGFSHLGFRLASRVRGLACEVNWRDAKREREEWRHQVAKFELQHELSSKFLTISFFLYRNLRKPVPESVFFFKFYFLLSEYQTMF